jgi:cell division transport system permease protein
MALRPDQRSRAEHRAASLQAPNTSLVAALAQHQSAAVDSLQRLLREPFGTAMASLVIGIALALPLALFLFLQNLQSLGSGIEQHNNISVFMAERDPSALLRVQKMLSNHKAVKKVTYTTPDQALQEFQAKSGFGEALATLDQNPLPPVFDVQPASDNAADVATLVSYLQGLPGVDAVQADVQWLQRLNAIVAVAQQLALLLALLLGIGVILVIGNTVRLAIANRRAEIVVVKLVGGTDAYVARPFLYTGFWYGVGGGLAALVLVELFLWGMSGPLARLLASYDSHFTMNGLGVSGGFAVLLLAGALGWLGALVSVLRHLRAIEPR